MFEENLFELVKKAVTVLPPDVENAIKDVSKRETGPAKVQMDNILKNLELAKQNQTAICQDTGFPIFYIFGRSLPDIDFSGVIKQATEKGVIRPNMVDPLTRTNNGDNLGEDSPFIKFNYRDTTYTDVWYLPKGVGSENQSRYVRLRPLDGWGEIKEVVIETVKQGATKSCSPLIIGLGIGGTMDHATYLSKKALLRPIENLTGKEIELTDEINELGIGPMGVGGKTTCLCVNIETAATHTGTLPVAINMQCWCHRKAGMRINGDDVQWL